MPQWPWSVYSQKHMSEITSRSGAASLIARMALGHDPLRIVVVAARRVLVLGDAEEDDGRDAQGGDLARLSRQQVDGQLGLAGHRLDGNPLALAVAHEEREDEVLRRERGLAHHRAQAGRQPEAPRPGGRETKRYCVMDQQPVCAARQRLLRQAGAEFRGLFRRHSAARRQPARGHRSRSRDPAAAAHHPRSVANAATGTEQPPPSPARNARSAVTHARVGA